MQRRRHSKVRTGCTICKRRRIKCDEAKPECMRCLKSGWQCEGYNVPKAWLFEPNRLGPSSEPNGEQEGGGSSRRTSVDSDSGSQTLRSLDHTESFTGMASLNHQSQQPLSVDEWMSFGGTKARVPGAELAEWPSSTITPSWLPLEFQHSDQNSQQITPHPLVNSKRPRTHQQLQFSSGHNLFDSELLVAQDFDSPAVTDHWSTTSSSPPLSEPAYLVPASNSLRSQHHSLSEHNSLGAMPIDPALLAISGETPTVTRSMDSSLPHIGPSPPPPSHFNDHPTLHLSEMVHDPIYWEGECSGSFSRGENLSTVTSRC